MRLPDYHPKPRSKDAKDENIAVGDKPQRQIALEGNIRNDTTDRRAEGQACGLRNGIFAGSKLVHLAAKPDLHAVGEIERTGRLEIPNGRKRKIILPTNEFEFFDPHYDSVVYEK